MLPVDRARHRAHVCLQLALCLCLLGLGTHLMHASLLFPVSDRVDLAAEQPSSIEEEFHDLAPLAAGEARATDRCAQVQASAAPPASSWLCAPLTPPPN